MFDYLAEHPTAAEILAAVYEVKPKYSSTLAKKAREMLGPNPNKESMERTEQEFNQLPGIFGQAPGSMPEDFKENIRFAEELKKKMRIN